MGVFGALGVRAVFVRISYNPLINLRHASTDRAVLQVPRTSQNLKILYNCITYCIRILLRIHCSYPMG